jgi:predicted ATP-dependent serine protease
VAQVDQRIAEAAKLGFKSFVLPETNMKKAAHRQGIELRGIGTIGAGIDAVL